MQYEVLKTGSRYSFYHSEVIVILTQGNFITFYIYIVYARGPIYGTVRKLRFAYMYKML